VSLCVCVCVCVCVCLCCSISAEWVGPTGELVQDELTRTVSYSTLALNLESSISQPIPGYLFSVVTSVTSVANPSARIEPQSVTIALFAWDGTTPIVPDRNTGAIATQQLGTAIDTCTASVGSDSTPVCEFSLPDIGTYVLIGSTADSGNMRRTVSTTLPFGFSQDQWRRQPLTTLSPLSAVMDKTEYSVGEQASIRFFNPFASVQTLLVLDQQMLASKVVRAEKAQGIQQLDFTVDRSCIGQCSVVVVIAAARNADFELPAELPVSPVADVLQPFTDTRTFIITVHETKTLQIELVVSSPMVAPSSEISLQIDLKSTSTGQNVGGEVALFLVNKAWLDLAPPSSSDLKQDLEPQMQLYTQAFSSTQQTLVSGSAFTNVAEIVERRTTHDPWTTPSWPLRASDWSARNFALSDEEYYHRLFSTICAAPYSTSVETDGTDRVALGGAVADGAPQALPQAAMQFADGEKSGRPESSSGSDSNSAASDASASTSASVSGSTKVRSDFTVTPYHKYALAVPSNGRATVTFNAPESVGTFVIRAFATTVAQSSHDYANTESEVIVRQPIGSLNANMPRVVRLGDVFSAGATFTASNVDYRGMVMVELHIDCSLMGFVGSAVEELVIDRETAREPLEVLFDLKPLRIGTVKYRITATAEGEVIDAFEASVVVLGAQEPVFVASSVAIDATESGAEWNEGIALPAAVPHTGTLVIDAGVGHLTSIYSYCRAILAMPYLSAYPTSDAIASSLAPRAVLDPYPAVSVDAAQLGKLTRTEFSHAINHLRARTIPEYGLQWLATTPYPSYNPNLNAFALNIASRSRLALGSAGTVPADLITAWSAGLENGLYQYLSYSHNNFYDWDLLASTYLAFGTSWTPQSYTRMLSFQSLLQHINDCSASGKATVALAMLFDRQPPSTPEIQSIIEYLQSNLRVQGRTAYISWGHGSAHADVIASALTLHVFALAGVHDLTVDKLAAFVAQTGKPTDMYHTWSSQQMVYASFALAAYDQTRGNTKPDVKFSALHNNSPVLEAHFTAKNLGPAHAEASFDDLAPSSSSSPYDAVTFYTKGTGEVSVVYGMQFVPSNVFSEPVYRGLYVTKMIQRVDLATGRASGPMLTHVSRGEHVRVTIQISTPDDLQDVLLSDPLAGGLEALDDNLFHIPGSDQPSFSSSRYWWWSWAGFNTKAVHADSVQFLARWLWAGTHQVTYDAIVVTRGQFVVPPAKASVLAQPELMGLSAGGSISTVTVRIPTDLASSSDLQAHCFKDTELPIDQPQRSDTMPQHSNVSGNDDKTLDQSNIVMIAIVCATSVLLVAAALALAAIAYLFMRRRRATSVPPIQLGDTDTTFGADDLDY
jgi:hypothetical protein